MFLKFGLRTISSHHTVWISVWCPMDIDTWIESLNVHVFKGYRSSVAGRSEEYIRSNAHLFSTDKSDQRTGELQEVMCWLSLFEIKFQSTEKLAALFLLQFPEWGDVHRFEFLWYFHNGILPHIRYPSVYYLFCTFIAQRRRQLLKEIMRTISSL